MATIPTVLDYGARPSLRSNRVDVPGTGNLEFANALTVAATNFANMMEERGEKKDRLNYALGKNEILQLDIGLRESFKDRKDYESFVPEYDEKFKAGRDAILANRGLPSDDNALLGSESELVGARGRAAVSEFGRGIMLDIKKSDLMDGLDAAHMMINTPTGQATRNDILLSQLDAITAAGEEKVLTDVEVTNLRESFTQKVALSALAVMDPLERQRVLEASLAHRKAGGPLTPEDIRKGLGTNSIADFLHTDTATKLLEATVDENKNEEILTTAFSVVDQILEEFPEAEQWSERNKRLIELTEGNPEARKESEILHRLRTASLAADDGAKGSAAYKDWGDKIIAGEATYSDIPAADRTAMGPERVKSILDMAENMPERKGHAESDDKVTLYKWRRMSAEEKADAVLMSPDWIPRLTYDTWKSFLAESQAYRDAGAKPGKDPNIYRGDPDDEVLRSMMFGAGGFFKVEPKKGTPNYQTYLAIDTAVNKALTNESLRRYTETGTGYMEPQEIYRITGEILSRQVWVRRDWKGDLRTVADAVTPDQVVETYIPMKEWKGELYGDEVDSMGNPLSIEQYLRNLNTGADLTDKDLEEAYYYLRMLPEPYGAQAAENRLKGVKGY